jgi:SAM-dependent methyltransferase
MSSPARTEVGELTPAEANRLFYASYAKVYDATEFCAHAPEAQRRLREALEPALGVLGPGARVLDAGGGSGNASALMLQRGFEPVLVDVSEEMVARWREKASVLGFEPETQVSSLEQFLAADQRNWDLIVFSSVLHHLEDPVGLLESARRRLAPGGFIVTVFDPLELGSRGIALRKLDYLLWLITRSPGALPGLIRRRLRPAAPGPGEPNVGAIAEYHAVRGISDRAIIEALGRSGLDVVAHQQNHDARFAAVRAIARALRMPTAFSLALRAPSGPAVSAGPDA